MRNHDNRIFEINQEVLQPVNGVQIQVVGGLVQQKDIRVAEQGLGQEHFHLDTAVQIPHGGIMEVRVYSQAV